MKPEQVDFYEKLVNVSKSLADYYADLCTLNAIYLQQVLVASRNGDPEYDIYVARLQSIRLRLRLMEYEALKHTY